jgi:3-dehydroquinate synthase
VKVACIRSREFFEVLERNAVALARFQPAAMRKLIHRCAELHLDHIATSGDPFEFGSARPLDFGHWAAHKLEQLSNFTLRHGEAVAIGIALVDLFHKLGCLNAASRGVPSFEALGFDLFTNNCCMWIRSTHCRPGWVGGSASTWAGRLASRFSTGIGQGFEVLRCADRD